MFDFTKSNAYISDRDASFQFGLELANEHLNQISSLSENNSVDSCHVGFKCENLYVIVLSNNNEKKLALPATPRLNSKLSAAHTMAAIRGYIHQLEKNLMVELDPTGSLVRVDFNGLVH